MPRADFVTLIQQAQLMPPVDWAQQTLYLSLLTNLDNAS